MPSDGYSPAFWDQPLPSYAAYSQFTGHGLKSSHNSGPPSTNRTRRTSTPSSRRGNSRPSSGTICNINTTEVAQQERFSLIQALQAHLEHEIQQYLLAGAPLERVAELWSGQVTANRLITDDIQGNLTFARSEGWNDRGRPSHGGSRIIRRGLNGHTEVVRPFLILEMEDVGPWKPWYKDAGEHRVDGPNGTAFTGKHLAISLGIEFGGQMEVGFGHSSGGKAIFHLDAEDCRHKFVLCDETEVDYVRANVPVEMTIVPTTGFRYRVYGVFDMTQTRKIDCDNRFPVKIGQPTAVGIALIRKLRAKVNAFYQTSLDSSNDAVKHRTDGGLLTEPPFEPTNRNFRLWHAALDAKDARYESFRRDSRRFSQAPMNEKSPQPQRCFVDDLPSLCPRKRRAEYELEPGEIAQEAVSGAEEHLDGKRKRRSFKSSLNSTGTSPPHPPLSNKRLKLSDHESQQEFKIKGNANRGSGDCTTEKSESSQSEAVHSDRPARATRPSTDLEQATSRGERTTSTVVLREKPDRQNTTHPVEKEHHRRDASVTSGEAHKRAVASEVRAVIASGEDARRRRGSNR